MRSFPNLGNKHACFKMPEHLCLHIWNREKGEQPDTSESDCCCKKDQKTLCIGPTACLLRMLSTSNEFPLTFIISVYKNNICQTIFWFMQQASKGVTEVFINLHLSFHGAQINNVSMSYLWYEYRNTSLPQKLGAHWSKTGLYSKKRPTFVKCVQLSIRQKVV